MMNNKLSPTVECQMLIRKPPHQVFEAFIDPEITTQFWFSKSTGKLEEGKTIIWEWEMYGVSTTVFVKEVKKPKTIVIQWGEPRTTVEFIFEERLDGFTYVTIKNYGFQLEPEELIETIKGNTGGFTTVLDGLKAYLEFGIRLKLVEDKFPQHLRDDWSKYTSED